MAGQADGTLQHTGGRTEDRGGRTPFVDPAQVELKRQQEEVGAMIDDLQATLFNPLLASFPGLAVSDKPFTLPDPDEEGIEWTFTPHFQSGNQKVSSVFVEGQIRKTFQGGEDGQTILVGIRANMDRASIEPFNSIGFKSPYEGIGFMQRKIQSILAPTKAAQTAVIDALPRWRIGAQGERVLTVPQIDPQNQGGGYIDDHP